jgi:hypothetical protein
MSRKLRKAFVIPPELSRMSHTGQVPTSTKRAAMQAERAFAKPKAPTDADRARDTSPRLTTRSVVDGLGLDRGLVENYRKFLDEQVGSAANEVRYRQAIIQKMHDDRLDPDKRRVLADRALSYYRFRHDTAKKSILTLDDLQKADPRGGQYYRRVPTEKGNRYYYDEDRYHRRQDAHVSGSDVLRKRQEKAMPSDNKPGESLDETPTAELAATLDQLKARHKESPDPGTEGRIKAISAELSKRGKGMEKAELSPQKARQILHDGTVGGKPITDQQRKYFGAVASGSALSKGEGEGSRGGKVTGHTASGKPIYAASHENYSAVREAHEWSHDQRGKQLRSEFKNYSPQDHRDAADAHTKDYNDKKGTTDAQVMSYRMASAHNHAARQKEHGVESIYDIKKSQSVDPIEELGEVGDALVKGEGEGSRGGHVVGHTASGKPIYERHVRSIQGFHKDIEDREKVKHVLNRFEDGDGSETKIEGYTPAGARQALQGLEGAIEQKRKNAEKYLAYAKEYGKVETNPEEQAEHGMKKSQSVTEVIIGESMRQMEEGAERQKRIDEAAETAAAGNGGYETRDTPEDETEGLTKSLDRWLSKGEGEGSRGGKVIGHTASGKPVYGSNHAAYQRGKTPASSGWTRADHQDAAEIHEKNWRQQGGPGAMSGTPRYGATKEHRDAAEAHVQAAAEGKGGSSVPEQHAAKIARQTARMPSAMRGVMGGKSMSKSMEDKMDLDGWLQKSGVLPEGGPDESGYSEGTEVSRPEDGGKVMGVGKPDGNPENTGNGSKADVGGAPSVPTEKLSEDDADVDQQMTDHTKPLGKLMKSLDHANRDVIADDPVAGQRRQARQMSQLRKGQSRDVYIPVTKQTPAEPLAKSDDTEVFGVGRGPVPNVQVNDGLDRYIEDNIQGPNADTFYPHGRPTIGAVGNLQKSHVCGACGLTKSMALSGCPHCGTGTVVQHAGVIGGGILVKSDRPGPGIRKPAVSVEVLDGGIVVVDE